MAKKYEELTLAERAKVEAFRAQHRTTAARADTISPS